MDYPWIAPAVLVGLSWVSFGSSIDQKFARVLRAKDDCIIGDTNQVGQTYWLFLVACFSIASMTGFNVHDYSSKNFDCIQYSYFLVVMPLTVLFVCVQRVKLPLLLHLMFLFVRMSVLNPYRPESIELRTFWVFGFLSSLLAEVVIGNQLTLVVSFHAFLNIIGTQARTESVSYVEAASFSLAFLVLFCCRRALIQMEVALPCVTPPIMASGCKDGYTDPCVQQLTLIKALESEVLKIPDQHECAKALVNLEELAELLGINRTHTHTLSCCDEMSSTAGSGHGGGSGMPIGGQSPSASHPHHVSFDDMPQNVADRSPSQLYPGLPRPVSLIPANEVPQLMNQHAFLERPLKRPRQDSLVMYNMGSSQLGSMLSTAWFQQLAQNSSEAMAILMLAGSTHLAWSNPAFDNVTQRFGQGNKHHGFWKLHQCFLQDISLGIQTGQTRRLTRTLHDGDTMTTLSSFISRAVPHGDYEVILWSISTLPEQGPIPTTPIPTAPSENTEKQYANYQAQVLVNQRVMMLWRKYGAKRFPSANNGPRLSRGYYKCYKADCPARLKIVSNIDSNEVISSTTVLQHNHSVEFIGQKQVSQVVYDYPKVPVSTNHQVW